MYGSSVNWACGFLHCWLHPVGVRLPVTLFVMNVSSGSAKVRIPIRNWKYSFETFDALTLCPLMSERRVSEGSHCSSQPYRLLGLGKDFFVNVGKFLSGKSRFSFRQANF